jgi:hypothetical protein
MRKRELKDHIKQLQGKTDALTIKFEELKQQNDLFLSFIAKKEVGVEVPLYLKALSAETEAILPLLQEEGIADSCMWIFRSFKFIRNELYAYYTIDDYNLGIPYGPSYRVKTLLARVWSMSELKKRLERRDIPVSGTFAFAGGNPVTENPL